MRPDVERRMSGRRRREALAFGVSGALHLAILFGFLWITPAIHTFEAPPETSVEVELVAPPDALPAAPGLVAATSQAAPQPSASKTALTRARARPRAAPPPSPAASVRPSSPRPVTRPPAFTAPTAAPASGPKPGPASNHAAGRGPIAGPGLAMGPYAGDEGGGDVREFLRTTVGCSHQDYLNLNKAERDECHRQFGAADTKVAGHVDPIKSASKRVAYDQARETCDRLHHYATPLDNDSERSAKPPGRWGVDALGC